MKLFLVRHAKSDWPSGVADIERPLLARGVADAVVAGKWLRDHGFSFDNVLVSPAERTRSTWLHMNTRLELSASVNVEPDIYEAHPLDLLRVINHNVCENLAVIGHGPGIPLVARFLLRPALRDELPMKYPTMGITVLETSASEWAEGCAELRDFVKPRG
jgi:phosphohistidine phosphatase